MSSRLTSSQLDRLAVALRASTGLMFPRARRPLLRRAALEALRDSGVSDVEDFVQLVCSDDRQRSLLAGRATVGETYLFRYGEQLEEVRRQVIEPLVAERRRQARPRLRIWSAACSTGEEAYTLAILVAEAVGDLRRWDIRVVGSDLNGEALTHARRGLYGRWSLRGSWAGHRRWLTPTRDGVRVAPAIRGLVTFEEHNLATLPGLPASLRDGPIDLILCRNVMIYLDRPVIARLLDGFHRSLSDGGWLVVAPVETSIAGLRQQFEAQSTAAGTLYRRAGAGAAGRFMLRRSPPATPTGGPVPAARTVPSVTTAPGPVGTLAQSGIEVLLATCRSLADSGRLPEARDQCAELLRTFPLSVEGHLLLAAIAEGQDDLGGASASLRRALYLDPGNASAQFRLGLLEWRRGGVKQAAARLQHAVQLVEGYGPEESLDDLHQLTAARVRGVVEALLV